MAYEKHTWETGEVITAEKLNNIEDGIESGNSLNLVNGEAQGSLTLGKGTTDETTITAAQLKALLALLNA